MDIAALQLSQALFTQTSPSRTIRPCTTPTKGRTPSPSVSWRAADTMGAASARSPRRSSVASTSRRTVEEAEEMDEEMMMQTDEIPQHGHHSVPHWTHAEPTSPSDAFTTTDPFYISVAQKTPVRGHSSLFAHASQQSPFCASQTHAFGCAQSTSSFGQPLSGPGKPSMSFGSSSFGQAQPAFGSGQTHHPFGSAQPTPFGQASSSFGQMQSQLPSAPMQTQSSFSQTQRQPSLGQGSSSTTDFFFTDSVTQFGPLSPAAFQF